MVTEPVVDPDATREEWAILKPLVVNSGYPRDKMAPLWGLINQWHKEQFPNLLKLAALALTTAILTADCERSFNAQNQLKTALRNRMSPERPDDLMAIKMGPASENFDFDAALAYWREAKHRKLFNRC